MRKRIFSLLLVMVMLLALVPTAISGADIAQSGTCGANLTWTLDSDGVLTVSGSGAMTNYSTTTKAPWGTYNANVKSIVIEDGVTTIGNYAFFGCTSVTGSVVIPDSVTAIGSSAFEECSKLNSLTIGSGVTTIGRIAFNKCYNLTEIIFRPVHMTLGSTNSNDALFNYAGRDAGGIHLIIDSTVDHVPNNLLLYANVQPKITALTIREGVRFIGDSAFSGYQQITGELMIPDSVINISSYAFRGCTGLTGLTLGDGLISIGSSAFYGCSGLTGVVFGSHVNTIDSSAFYNCKTLTEVTLPDSVEAVNKYAFAGCTGLTKVHFGSSLKTLGDAVFNYDTKLADVYFHGNVPTSMSTSAFPARAITGHYPCGNSTWNSSTLINYGKTTFTWEKIHTALRYYDGYPAGCTSEGWEPYEGCDNCNGYTTKKMIQPLGHTHDENSYRSVTEPTCTEQGYTKYRCTRCINLYDTDYVDALGHDFGEWTVDTAPTCTEKGVERHDCNRCDAYENREVEALGHSYTTTVTAPTYTEQGYTTHTCACGDSYVDGYVPALGDFNGDSAVNNDDLVMLLRHVAKIQMVTDKAVLTKLDINKDGKINAEDITLLTQSLETAG